MRDEFCDSCEELKTDPERISRVRSCLISDDKAAALAEVFKMLGDQTRIKIIFALSCCEMCVCDIAETIGMTQSAVSHQLRLMRNMKLVKYRKEGKSVYYSLDDDHILQLFSQGMEHVKHG
ncbi:MAG: helix-turn-helix transcriptional regulator [Clostridiaceae bacterium]|jgi:DNA-binding transcriptional ArsR family regulator|nr:helix-turn-helix transcriptional regulator [Clostridiaceae bacterium]